MVDTLVRRAGREGPPAEARVGWAGRFVDGLRGYGLIVAMWIRATMTSATSAMAAVSSAAK